MTHEITLDKLHILNMLSLVVNYHTDTDECCLFTRLTFQM